MTPPATLALRLSVRRHRPGAAAAHRCLPTGLSILLCTAACLAVLLAPSQASGLDEPPSVILVPGGDAADDGNEDFDLDFACSDNSNGAQAQDEDAYCMPSVMTNIADIVKILTGGVANPFGGGEESSEGAVASSITSGAEASDSTPEPPEASPEEPVPENNGDNVMFVPGGEVPLAGNCRGIAKRANGGVEFTNGTCKLVVKRVIASGAFADVFEAEFVSVGQRLGVAVKQVHQRCAVGSLKEEYQFMEWLIRRYPRALVVNPHAVGLKSGFLVMDLGKTNLLDLVMTKATGSSLDPSLLFVKHVMFEILLGLMSMHADGYAHRDLRPDNFIIGERVNTTGQKIEYILFADFGSACVFEPGKVDEALDKKECHGWVGSPLYLPPEALSPPTHRDFVAMQDVWAAGVIVAWLLKPLLVSEDFIFKELHKDPRSAIDRLVEQRSDLKTELGEAMVSVLRKMLEVDPMARPLARICFEELEGFLLSKDPEPDEGPNSHAPAALVLAPRGEASAKEQSLSRTAMSSAAQTLQPSQDAPKITRRHALIRVAGRSRA